MDAGGILRTASTVEDILSTELAEVVIDVPVPIPSPHRLWHLSPSPVRRESLALLLDEFCHQRLKLGDVRLKHLGGRAVYFLILLRGCSEPLRPWQGRGEGHKAEELDAHCRRVSGDGPMAENAPEPVAQVANRLVW